MQVINPKWSMDADGARISFRVPTVQEGREQCDNMLEAWGQDKAMQEQGWTKEDFTRIFGKNYLED